MSEALVVWQLCDGKRGHERQAEGLIAALGARRPLAHHRVRVSASAPARGADFVRSHLPGTADLPAPHFIIGAGRACQWPLLTARRAHGGCSIYLMRPILPAACFDLCIIPRHDRPRAGPHVLVSEGPLNPVRPSSVRHAELGVILLGGPSAHHEWDTGAVLAQVARIVRCTPALDWVLGDSRRSPATLAHAARDLAGVRFVSHCDTAPGWLPEMLGNAAQIWVSADSVGMLFEALSAGAAVGVIEVPARRLDRITAIAGDLHARGWVGTLADLERGTLPRPPVVLDEAGRAADFILARWPGARAGPVA